MEVENWDLDGDFATETGSRVPSSTFSSFAPSSRGHRDSTASRLSHRSEAASSARGGEEEHEIQLSDEAEQQGLAVALAARKGIPIPANVPLSALTGGTIKKLGGRKTRKAITDDWAEDIELPATSASLSFKRTPDTRSISDAFRSLDISSNPTPSESPSNSTTFADRMAQKSQALSPSTLLSKYRDNDADEDDVFADFNPRSIESKSKEMISGIGQQKQNQQILSVDDDFEADLELPNSGAPLKLALRDALPHTPSIIQDDFDEWAEGSLGTRGGNRLGTRSARSSSVSALSPSMSSTFTAESEDEGLTGLTLPLGPINLEARLKLRQSLPSDDSPIILAPQIVPRPPSAHDDTLDDLDFGDDSVFDAAKLSLNRNIQIRNRGGESTLKRAAVSLTFTSGKTSRLPRPVGGHNAGSRLQPVHEDEAAPSYSRSESRMSTTATPSVPSTPSRNRAVPSLGLGRPNPVSKPPQPFGRPDSTTSGSQFLRSKRSMPIMQITQPTPQKTLTTGRPPSRTGDGRPKTPSSRLSADLSQLTGRQPPVPFLPPGGVQSRSYHANLRSRNNRRTDSESSAASDHSGRPVSRSTLMRSPSPRRKNCSFAPEALLRQATNKQPILRPAKSRRYGEGNELDAFDDLPTNNAVESKFVKKPAGSRTIIPKTSKTNLAAAQMRPETPSMSRPSSTVPPSPARSGQTPSFARDTAASRAARENRENRHSVPQTHDRPQPLTSVNANARARIPVGATPHNGPLASAMTPSLLSPPATAVAKHPRSGTRKPKAQQKPHLIRQLGDQGKNIKAVNGMTYDPIHCVWKGNDTAVAEFDKPTIQTPTTATINVSGIRGHLHASPSTGIMHRPALISGMGLSASLPQVVNGMVFDPKRQTWLKKAPDHHHSSTGSSSVSALSSSAAATAVRKPRAGSIISTATADDDADPFEGFEELDDTLSTSRKSMNPMGVETGTDSKRADIGDEIGGFLVGEEFDVGPRFIQKIEEEEAVWRLVAGQRSDGKDGLPEGLSGEELGKELGRFLPDPPDAVREMLRVLEGARNPMGDLGAGIGMGSGGMESLNKYREEETEDWGDL